MNHRSVASAMLFSAVVWMSCILQWSVAPSEMMMMHDYSALSTPIVYEKIDEAHQANGGTAATVYSAVFHLNYSQLGQWRPVSQQFAADIGIDRDYFADVVYNLLDALQYPTEIIGSSSAPTPDVSGRGIGFLSDTIEVYIGGDSEPPLAHYRGRAIDSREAVGLLSRSACLWGSLVSTYRPNVSSEDLSSTSPHGGDLFYLHSDDVDEEEEPASGHAYHDFSREIRSRTMPSTGGDALRRDYKALLDDEHHGCRDQVAVNRHLLASLSTISFQQRDDYYSSWLSSFFSSNAVDRSRQQRSPRILIYQTIGAFTGGTAAMHTLYETLHSRLGYPHVVLCNDSNRGIPACSDPLDIDLVVTGEWCHEVLAEYTQLHREHSGRGLQYYLGFHHADDSCPGRPAIGISQYLSDSLSSKVLGGLFLSTPMNNIIRHAFELLLCAGDTMPGGDRACAVPVKKEDLVLVDPDFFSDYPPSPTVAFAIPRGFKVLYARGIAAADMPLVLQRAKIVLDLALPGVERLAIEGILFGAIPIISNRWVGSSGVDYTGVLRVDAQNGSHISEVLARVAMDYETELQSLHNAAFFHQTMRMWDRMLRSTDVVVGSSHLHFVLYARSLDEEDKLLLQVLALLYHYPLCSVDAYVVDVVWFVRQHYGLFKTLQRAGYIRYDPLHPDEYLKWMKQQQQQPGGQRSFIELKPISAIIDRKGQQSSSDDDDDPQTSKVLLRDSPLVPAWSPLLVLLRSDLALCDWRFLLEQLRSLGDDEVRVLLSSSSHGGSTVDMQDCTLSVLAAPNSDSDRVMALLRLLMGGQPTTRPQCGGVRPLEAQSGSQDPSPSSHVTLPHREVGLHFTSICYLYERRRHLPPSAGSAAACHRFRSRIQQSTGWMQAVQTLRSTGLRCE